MEEKDQKIADLEAKLAESEEKVKHWHNLYNERDRQFQSVRQRYHLLNKLQSNYDKKDKLHLAYMQCAELVDENEQLKQQLAEKEKEIVKEKTQDKISFAVEQLEKVYEYAADVWWVDGVSEAVCNFIYQQIKDLKEKTNVKD